MARVFNALEEPGAPPRFEIVSTQMPAVMKDGMAAVSVWAGSIRRA
jgi:hypothetical protein